MDRCLSGPLRTSVIFAIAVVTSVASDVAAATLSFDDDCGNGDWLTSCGGKTNWSPDALPTAADDATVGATFAVTLAAPGPVVSVRSVDIAGGLTIDGRDLALQAASSIHNLDLSLSAVTSALASGSGGGTALRLSGQSVLRESSTLRGGPSLATFRNNEELGIVGSTVLESVILLNASLLTQKASVTLLPGSIARNQGTWSLDAEGADVSRAQSSEANTARFENTGSLRNESGDNSVDVSFFSDTGSVAVDADRLAFVNNASFGSAIAINTGAQLVLNAGEGVTHTFRNHVTVGGRGQLSVSASGGHQVIDGELINVLDGTTGGVSLESIDLELAAAATLINRGLLRWGTGAIAGGRVSGAGSITNDAMGLLRLDAVSASLGVPLTNLGQVGQDGMFTLADTTFPEQVAISNERSGLWRLEHAAIASLGSGHFRNRGTIVAPVNSGTSTVDPPLDLADSGTLAVESDAVVVLRGGGEWTATHPITVNGYATLQGGAGQDARVYSVAGSASFGGTGEVIVDAGATLRVLDDLSNATTVRLSGGVLSGPGRVVSSARLQLDDGSLGTLAGGGVQVSNVGFAFVAGDVEVRGASRLENLGSDLDEGRGWIVGPTAKLSLGAASRLHNAGALALVGSNVIDGEGILSNTGTLTRGLSDVEASVGTTTIASTFSSSGTVHVLDGTLNFTGSLSDLVAGRLERGTWLVDDGADLTSFDEVTTIGADARVVIPSNNLGSLFDRLQRVEGSLTVGDNLRATSLEISERGRFATRGAISGGIRQVGISLDGGALTNHGVVAPGGDAFAVVTVGGVLDQQADGVLRVDVSAGGSDRLVVSGAASLAGRLEVVLSPGFVPDASDEFTVLTADRVDGQFANAVGRAVVVGEAGSFAVRYTADSVELFGFEAGPLPSATPTRVATIVPTPTATARATEICGGDCDLDRAVTVDEILKGVNIALGTVPLSACSPFDRSADGKVTVDEIVSAVNSALVGCPSTLRLRRW